MLLRALTTKVAQSSAELLKLIPNILKLIGWVKWLYGIFSAWFFGILIGNRYIVYNSNGSSNTNHDYNSKNNSKNMLDK